MCRLRGEVAAAEREFDQGKADEWARRQREWANASQNAYGTEGWFSAMGAQNAAYQPGTTAPFQLNPAPWWKVW
jgi:hypothetical protein